MCGAVDLPVLPVIANEVPAGTFDPAPLIKTLLLWANLSWTPKDGTQRSTTWPYPSSTPYPSISASTLSAMYKPAAHPISIPLWKLFLPLIGSVRFPRKLVTVEPAPRIDVMSCPLLYEAPDSILGGGAGFGGDFISASGFLKFLIKLLCFFLLFTFFQCLISFIEFLLYHIFTYLISFSVFHLLNYSDRLLISRSSYITCSHISLLLLSPIYLIVK